mgnify:CR=1 FL=1
MDKDLLIEMRVKNSYEHSFNTAIKRMEHLQGEDLTSLCDEWREYLLNDISDLEIDYLEYWDMRRS